MPLQKGAKKLLCEGDIFVDATGANSVVGEAFGIPTTILGKKQMMLTFVVETSEMNQGLVKKSATIDFVFNFYVPGFQYKLIQPSKQVEERLLQLLQEGEKEAIERLQDEIYYEQTGQHLKEVEVSDKGVVPVTLSLRDVSSLVKQKTLFMFVGDSYVTPDPKSGSGGGQAITGGMSFSMVLDRWGTNPLDSHQLFFDYSAQAHADRVIESGFQRREDCSPSHETHSGAYFIRSGYRQGWLDHEQMLLVTRLYKRSRYDLEISDEEKVELGKIVLSPPSLPRPAVQFDFDHLSELIKHLSS